MDKRLVMAWRRGFETAREMERVLTTREPVDVQRSLGIALELIEAALRRDPSGGRSGAWERDVERVRERWRALKRAYHR